MAKKKDEVLDEVVEEAVVDAEEITEDVEESVEEAADEVVEDIEEDAVEAEEQEVEEAEVEEAEVEEADPIEAEPEDIVEESTEVESEAVLEEPTYEEAEDGQLFIPDAVNPVFENGAKLEIASNPIKVFRTSVDPNYSRFIAGTVYIWDAAVSNGRVRITHSAANVGNIDKLLGWVDVKELVAQTH